MMKMIKVVANGAMIFGAVAGICAVYRAKELDRKVMDLQNQLSVKGLYVFPERADMDSTGAEETVDEKSFEEAVDDFAERVATSFGKAVAESGEA